MTISATSLNSNVVQQKTSSSDVQKMDNSINIEIGKVLGNNKSDKVKNEKEIAKVEAKIAEKTETLNQLLDKINKNEYTREDRECVTREKHPIAHYGANVSRAVAVAGAGGLIGGASTGNLILAMVSGLGMAVGAAAGLGFTVYYDYKGNNITDEEVRNFYTQKVNELSAEVKELKQELNGLK